MKKFVKVVLLVCIALSLNSVKIEAEDYDFPNNEVHYYALCSKTGLSESEKTACKAFQTYLAKKASDMQSLVSNNNNQLATIKNDINAVLAKISELDKEIAKIEQQQKDLTTQINTIQANIDALVIQIEDRENSIEILDAQIKDRMVNIQSFVSLNQYVEFIMGANDFADLIRRTSAINEIMEYDTGQIKKLEDEKVLLKKDMEEMEEQKLSLDAQKSLLEETKTVVNAARAIQQELVNHYLTKKTELEAEMRQNITDLDEINKALNDIANAIGSVTPSPGWIYPVNGSWRISAGSFYYPGGGLHLGTDFAASSSRKVVAVANGVVLDYYTGCAIVGYLGSSCGRISGAGNHVLMAVQVGTQTYAVLMYHLQKDIGSYVKKGQIVTQGTILGSVGSSGSSTGNHVHVEIISLGQISLVEAARRFANNGDSSFGAGWRSINTTCDRKSIPCRLNPMKIFNVKVGQSGS